MNSRIDATNRRIDDLQQHLIVKIDSVDEKIDTNIDSLGNELKSEMSRVNPRVEDLDKRLNIAERLFRPGS